MAVTPGTAVVGTDPAAINQEFFRFQARDPSRIAQVFDKRMVRITATTTDATPGNLLALTSVTLDPAAGPLTFDAGTFRVIKVKAFAKPTGASTTTCYFEQAMLVLGGSTPTVIAPGALPASTAFLVDNGVSTGAITAVAGVGTLTLQLTGKAATNLNWVIDIQVDDAVGNIT